MLFGLSTLPAVTAFIGFCFSNEKLSSYAVWAFLLFIFGVALLEEATKAKTKRQRKVSRTVLELSVILGVQF